MSAHSCNAYCDKDPLLHDIQSTHDIFSREALLAHLEPYVRAYYVVRSHDGDADPQESTPIYWP